MKRAALLSLPAVFALALVGADPVHGQALDPRDRDATTAACMDFYQHANGGWLSSTPVPSGLASHGYLDELQAQAGERRRGLLLELNRAPENGLDAAIGRLYALGLDAEGRERAGRQPVEPWLGRIDALARPRDLPPLLADLHRLGLPVLFRFEARPDLERPQQVIAYALQGGLGLPDRDYYLRDDRSVRELREAYQVYVERLLALAGRSDAAAEAARVLAVEGRIAGAALTLEQLRDPRNSYRPTGVRELERAFPQLRWRDFLRAQGLRDVASVSLAHVSHFQAVDGLIGSLPMADWQAYLRFHVLHAAAPYLDTAFGDAHAQFFVETLAGQPRPAREAQVQAQLQRLLAEPLGQRYARRHMDPARREAALGLAEGLRAQFRAMVEGADWLQAEGRAAYLADIDRLLIAIGGPVDSGWESFGTATERYADGVLEASRFRHGLEMARVGKPAGSAWPLSPYALQPVYEAASHTLYLPAGLLQLPLFDTAADAALAQGSVGVLVARALASAYLPAGGARSGLLSQAEREAWTSRTTGLVSHYGSFVAQGRLAVDGAATWAENATDLLALTLAWNGFLAAGLEGGSEIDGLKPAQRFFHGWARLLRRNYTDEALRLQLATDPRAPAQFRVNGPLAHLPSFAAAFACEPGVGLVLPEPARVQPW